MAENCCPPGSWPYLVLEDGSYTPQGEVHSLPTASSFPLPIYYVGKAESSTSKGAVVVLPEVWGWAGRLKQICDTLAEQGYFVVMPDSHRKDTAEGKPAVPAWVKECEEKTPVVDDLKAVLSFVTEKCGGQLPKTSAIGFCWGAWAWARGGAAGLPFTCCISPHPSIKLEEFAFKLSQEELCRQLKFPTLLMPAANDPGNVKTGGALIEILLASGGEVVAFEEMTHGWMSRGDIWDEKVKRDVEKCMQLIVDFLGKHHK